MSILTTNDVLTDMRFFDDWESRYQYIIDLGHELEPLQETQHTSDRMVKGCQSNVWLEAQQKDGLIHLIVDSDALIVRGLLALVLAAYNYKTAEEISNFDIDGYFQELDLERHLSLTRGNGLRSIVAKIRAFAASILADKYFK